MRPKLITMTGTNISATRDSMIFHYGKGGGSDKTYESLPDVPYGIIQEGGYDNPFTLTANASALTVTLSPGMCLIHGRQIELTESVVVFDFHTSVESTVVYCTVYIEVNLEDMALQTAKILLDMSGAAYKNFRSSMVQDDLTKLGHGVFQAPLVRFTYTPGSANPFSDITRVMPVLPSEARMAVNKLTLTSLVNNVLLSDLGSSLKISGKRTFKWYKASNIEKLDLYNSIGTYTDRTAGYSLATGAVAIGPRGNSTEIPSDLSGVYTCKTYKVLSLDNNFCTPNMNWNVNISTKGARIKYVHLYTKKGNANYCTLKGHFKYRETRTTYLGIPWFLDRDLSLDFVLDQMISVSELNAGITKKFVGYFEHSVAGTDYQTWLAVLNNDTSEKDAYVDSNVAPIAGFAIGYHKYGELFLKIENGVLKLTGQGFGDSADFNVPVVIPVDWRYWKYFGLTNVLAEGDLYVDVIYEGDITNA